MKARYVGLVYGFSAGVCFGTASILIRLINLNALSIVTWRLIIGGLALMIISLALGKFTLNYLRNSMLLGSILFLHFYFFVKAVQDTYIMNATVLVNTAPIISLIIVALFKLEELRIFDGFIVVMAFIGVLIMFFSSFKLGYRIIGDVEALLAALMISIYTVLGRSLLRSRGMSLELASLIYVIAGVEALLINVSLGTLELTSTSTELFYILMLGLIPTAIGHTLFLASLKGLKPYETQLLALLEPIIATLLGFILFNEAPSLVSMIGALIIYLSVISLIKVKS